MLVTYPSHEGQQGAEHDSAGRQADCEALSGTSVRVRLGRASDGKRTALVIPIHSPLRLLEVSWMTRIMQSVMMPPLPTPSMTLPRIKTAKVGARAVTRAPRAKQPADRRTMVAGEKTMARRPARGATDDMLIIYELVNHMADS